MSKTIESNQVFHLGQVKLAPHAAEYFQRAGHRALDDLLAGHGLCYWGAVSPETERSNDRAVMRGRGMVVSAYTLESGATVVVDTNEDWSETTVCVVDDCLDAIFSAES